MLRRRRSERGRGERGVALLESAITMPLFFLLIFGTMEFGLAFRDYLTMSNAARDAARFGSTLGQAIDADFQMINEIAGNLDGLDVTKVVIFKATDTTSTTDSGALSACLTGSVTDLCNTYTGDALDGDVEDFGCGVSASDRHWCPTDRKVNLSDPPDYIGVYIEVKHTAVTGVLGIDQDFSEEVVLRMEPLRI